MAATMAKNGAADAPEAEQAAAPVKAEPRRMGRWDPLQVFDELQEEMARLFGGVPLALRPFAWPRPRLGQPTTAWAPRMDVYEKNGTLIAKAELPGVKKEDIEITLEAGDLVIRGERKTESEVKEEAYYRMERTYGSFYRRLPLPFEVAPEAITATFADGILEVRVPRPTQPKPEARKIVIE